MVKDVLEDWVMKPLKDGWQDNRVTATGERT